MATARKSPKAWKHEIIARADINFSEFRVVPGTENRFMVDRAGKVISDLWPLLPENYWLVVKISRSVNSKPFNRVHITPAGSDRGKLFQLGAVILSAWVGPRPSRIHQAAHKDGISTNDWLDNLAWRTPKEMADAREARGNTARGSKIRNGSDLVFNETMVGAIKQLAALGASGNLIATAMNVPQPRIAEIMRGDTWAHVPAQPLDE